MAAYLRRGVGMVHDTTQMIVIHLGRLTGVVAAVQGAATGKSLVAFAQRLTDYNTASTTYSKLTVVGDQLNALRE